MTIEVPPHDFHNGPDPSADTLIVTPQLQQWAAAAMLELGAAGRKVPADLIALSEGLALRRHSWWWLLDAVAQPKDRDCPF